MPFDLNYASDPIKIILGGRYGTGKTGSAASLIAAGYNVRFLNTDPGIKTLKSLLGHPKYPYADWFKRKGIDPLKHISVINVNEHMEIFNGIIKPKAANSWLKIAESLENWRDGDLRLGSITKWTNQDVLFFDNLSRASEGAFYQVQDLNKRLGQHPEGFEFQRDIYAAQTRIKSLMQLFFDDEIKCNVILITHIEQIDETRSAKKPDNDTPLDQIHGFPAAIGKAISPHIPEFMPDFYVARQIGSGSGARREISTVPQDGIITKASSFLKPSYPIETALAEIFAAMRGEDEPTELINALRAKKLPAPTGTKAESKVNASSEFDSLR